MCDISIITYFVAFIRHLHPASAHLQVFVSCLLTYYLVLLCQGHEGYDSRMYTQVAQRVYQFKHVLNYVISIVDNYKGKCGFLA